MVTGNRPPGDIGAWDRPVARQLTGSTVLQKGLGTVARVAEGLQIGFIKELDPVPLVRPDVIDVGRGGHAASLAQGRLLQFVAPQHPPFLTLIPGI